MVKLRFGNLYLVKCILYLVDFEKIEILQYENKWDELIDIMVNIVERFKDVGVDFIVICINIMYKMVEDIEEKVEIKVLYIVEIIGKEVIKRKIKKVGLLGINFIMEQDFYKKVLKDNFNIDVIIFSREEREIIYKVIYDELCKGIINEELKNEYIKIIDNLVLNGVEGIVFGCIEILLLIK